MVSAVIPAWAPDTAQTPNPVCPFCNSTAGIVDMTEAPAVSVRAECMNPDCMVSPAGRSLPTYRRWLRFY